MPTKKVVFLQNLIYPIRNPFFNQLTKVEGISLKVLFLSETSANRKWRIEKDKLLYPNKVLKNFKFKINDGDTFEYIINPFSLIDYFREMPDILITIGWANATNYLFMFMNLIRNKPFYIWCESTINEQNKRRSLMMPLIRFFVERSKGIIVPGILSAAYIKQIDKNAKIIVVPNSIDNERFYNKRRKGNTNMIKLLYVGRFEKIKGIDNLLEAFKNLSIKYPNKLELMLVGYGPEESSIKRIIKKYNLNVKMIPFVEPKELPLIYKNADIFILPSLREVWGFVINEAIAAGLPIIVSNKVGSSLDLVINGKNGYIFQGGDTLSLQSNLEKLISSPSIRLKMGKFSQKHILNFTYEVMLNSFLSNLKFN